MGRRVVAAFACGALALSLGLAVMTSQLSKRYLLEQRQRTVTARATVEAGQVATALAAPEPDPPRALAAVSVPAGSHALLLYQGQWFTTSRLVDVGDIPADARRRARSGTLDRRLFRLDGVTHVAVGVPLAGATGAYFDVTSLEELDRTLRVLRNALGAAAAATTVAGAAVGVWAARRLLRPLADAAHAASAVGSGRLDVRLDTTGDPDLDTLAEAFNDMTSALADRIGRDARFASSVSHELRSPLTTLATSVEVLLARRDDLPDRARTALDLLAADVRRFQRLVTDLLEMSRMEAGVAEVSLEVVHPEELARHALRSAQVPDVPIDVDPAAQGLLIQADKRRLERVIVNLVENAQTHGEGAVRMAIEDAGDFVRLVVEDAGPGIEREDRERIFEPFVRGRAAGRRGRADGTGLGLSLVAEHVRLHGGRVSVDDRPGGGARFVVELPATRQEAAARA